MPKTYNNLFESITEWENLYNAYLTARKTKRNNVAVLKFESCLEENLNDIQHNLRNHTWRPGNWNEFMIYDPKWRLIQAPPFQDRIVHHAIFNIINPLFERKFITHSFACRTGYGFHSSVKTLQKYLRKSGFKYVLKADISKYFQSINQDVLLIILQKTIKDQSLNNCLEIIIKQFETGMPVGSLISQLCANVYLNVFDHYVKDGLGLKFYIRYMDDFIILGKTKSDLWQTLEKLRKFLINNLKLTLNPKTKIFPISQGIDFCGFRTWPTHILPRKRTVKKAKKSINKLYKQYLKNIVNFIQVQEKIKCFWSYMKHCNGFFTINNFLTKGLKLCH